MASSTIHQLTQNRQPQSIESKKNWTDAILLEWNYTHFDSETPWQIRNDKPPLQVLMSLMA